MKNGVPLLLKIQAGKIFYVRLSCKSSSTKEHTETMTNAGALIVGPTQGQTQESTGAKTKVENTN